MGSHLTTDEIDGIAGSIAKNPKSVFITCISLIVLGVYTINW